MEKPNPVYSWALRAWAPVRWIVGGLLIVGGLFGVLPVLGFWMIPVGVLVVASGSPRVRETAKGAIRWLRVRFGLGGAADRARQRNHRSREGSPPVS